MSVWQDIPIHDCDEPLVELTDFGVICEPAYFNQGITDNPAILVRSTVAKKLVRVNQALDGLQLKVWDGYRPRQVQRALYQQFFAALQKQHANWPRSECHATALQFVAPPDTPGCIPPHTTGGAVDLTLVNEQGEELDMGTGFDDFTAQAATCAAGISAEAKHNRQTLLAAMSVEGFVNYPQEWWHFGYGDPLTAVLQQQPSARYGEINR